MLKRLSRSTAVVAVTATATTIGLTTFAAAFLTAGTNQTDASIASAVVHAQLSYINGGRPLTPDVATPVLVNIVNPTTEAVTITSIGAGTSQVTPATVVGDPDCPAASITTAAVTGTPLARQTSVGVADTGDVIPSGGNGYYWVTATFDTTSGGVASAQNQNSCMGLNNIIIDLAGVTAPPVV